MGFQLNTTGIARYWISNNLSTVLKYLVVFKILTTSLEDVFDVAVDNI